MLRRITAYFNKKSFYKEYKKKILNNSELKNISNFKEIFDTNLYIPTISLYDVLDNSGVTKLIKKIYKLKKDTNYKVDISFKKPKLNRYNYIYPEFRGNSRGIFATVEFEKDLLMRKIEITWTQINNEEAIICYSFVFKKWIDTETELKEYVKNNWEKIYSYAFVPYYKDLSFYLDNEYKNYELEHELFYYLLQGIIVDIFYTELGKHYILPKSTLNIVEKSTGKLKKYLKSPFLCFTYVPKSSKKKDTKDEYYVVNSIDEHGVSVEKFIIGKSYRSYTLLDFFADSTMEYYYQQFGNIEISELTMKMIKYLNKRKRNIKISDHKWLINKIRKINEKKLYKVINEYRENLSGYSNNVKNKDYISESNYLKKFKEIYEDNLEYIKSIEGVNYNYKIYVITFITLVLTIIGIAVTIILTFCI